MKHIFNKYKVLLLSLLLVATLVGGTYAYLVATDSQVVNTFKLARVDTDITEATDDNTRDNKANKEVKIRNKNVSNVYVRARVVVSGADAKVPDIDYVETETEVTGNAIKVLYNSTNWVKSAPDENGDVWFYYQGILYGTGKEGADHETAPLITKILVGDKVDQDAKFDVDIYQESILTSAETYTNGAAEAEFAKKSPANGG